MQWRHVDSGERERRDIRNLFLMTGADPNTDWLAGCVCLDDKKFVKTGADLLPEDLAGAHWTLPRRPYLLETSIPGVFCVGDARRPASSASRPPWARDRSASSSSTARWPSCESDVNQNSSPSLVS